jgi:hypothetical protein
LKSVAVAVTRSITRRADRVWPESSDAKLERSTALAIPTPSRNPPLSGMKTNLDKWLTDPETVIPNTDMAFRLDNSVERAAIIAFLKETGK